MWMIRSGRGGDNLEVFLRENLVGFGDAEIGVVAPSVTKDDLLRLYAQHYPHEKANSRASWASQLLRLITEVKVGDPVVTFDREQRRYIVGKISGEYRFEGAKEGHPAHVRPASWSQEVSRESLSAATRNTLGSVLTVFRVNPEAAKDVLANVRPLGQTPVPERAPTVVPDAEGFLVLTEDTIERANEFIEDVIDGLDWEDMQELVAGLLRAMGYRTTVAPRGPDRGVDIFASPDGLGLEEPRIFVEVKHRAAQMGSKEIRSFVGGRRKGDKCLYVSSAGFSKDAYYEAERAEVALQLITLPKLRQLVVDYYEKLDSETRALVPLRRLYWPAPREKS